MVLTVTYAAAILLVQPGLWLSDLWNFGVCGVMIGAIHLATGRFKDKRTELPAGPAAAAWLTALLLLWFGVLVAFMFAATTDWRPLLAAAYAPLELGRRLNLPANVFQVYDSAVAMLPLTVLAVVLTLWRVRRHGPVGFYFGWRYWVLAVVLTALEAGLGVVRNEVFGVWQDAGTFLPMSLWAVPIFLLQAMVNGLPEETLMRGYMFPQVYAFLRQPWIALLLASVLFAAGHLPEYLIIYGMRPWWHVALEIVFSPSLGLQGLVFGYLFWRSRSLVPGIFLHTYITVFTAASPFMW